MPLARRLILSLAALVFAGCGPIQAEPTANVEETITVKVVGGNSPAGLAGAKLQLIAEVGLPHLSGNWGTRSNGIGEMSIPAGTEDELKLWITADGFAPGEKILRRTFTGAFPDLTTVKLERAVSVGGRVLNEMGEPIAGVEVFVESVKNGGDQEPSSATASDGHFHIEKTDVKGRWSCNHAPRQLESLKLRFVHPDYVTAEVSMDHGKRMSEAVNRVTEAELQASNAVFILKRGMPINGVVLNANGRPVEGAVVSAGDYPVWTTADGRFNFNNQPEGEVTLTASARGLASAKAQIQVSSAIQEARIQLEPGRVFDVQIQDAKGRPIPGASVAVHASQSDAFEQTHFKSDYQGRLAWFSAPAEDIVCDVTRFGCEPLMSQSVKADGVEHVVTLKKQLRLSGRVIDAETRAPISEFRLVPGLMHGDHEDWNVDFAAKGRDGKFTVWLPNRPLPHVVRVEADGYFPAISAPFKDEVEEADLELDLKRGDPLTGVVRSRDGKPVAKAEVALCTADSTTVLGRAEFVGGPVDGIQQTDGHGAFCFQPQPGVKWIAVASEKGYAEISPEALKQTKSIQLKPWGRVSGVVQRSAARETNALMQLVRIGSFFPQFQVNSFTALTDSEGRFVFDYVPPASAMIGCLMDSQFTRGRAIDIAPGQTSEVIFDGGGRTVTGRIVPSDGRQILWESGRQPAFLRKALPAVELPKLPDSRATNAWWRAYWDSAEGMARQKSETIYALQFASSNIFTAENVLPGTYECEIHRHVTSATNEDFDTCLGILRQKIVVPEAPPERSGEPVDVGTLTINLKPLDP